MNIKKDESHSKNASDDFEKFVYLLSHDVRNSVRALIEVPQWIEEDLIASNIAIDPSLSENIALMNTHTRRLDSMLADLLTYSRVGRKQEVQTVNLGEAIQLVVEQLVIPKHFKLSVALDHTEIQIGTRDVLTFFSELIGNAIKHNTTAQSHLVISSTRLDDKCIIRFTDDGPGIPIKYRDRVFEAMTTLKPRDEVEGSGMGLATTKKIAEFYGAHLLWPENPNPTGTVLEFHFPI